MNTTPPFDRVIGLDRSDRKADLHQIDLPSGAEARQTIPTSPEALQAWADALHAAHPNARVAICFEQPANNLIAFLTRYPWITLYPINPISLQKFREVSAVPRTMARTPNTSPASWSPTGITSNPGNPTPSRPGCSTAWSWTAAPWSITAPA
jgi:hypothetical protein